MTIWHEQGGSGRHTVLLLHGLGATAAVWKGVAPLLEQRGMKWIAPDLSGHGLSPWHPTYSVGQLTAEVAPLVGDAQSLYVIGHSLGTYIGLALASRWFGVRVTGVLGVGPKVTWTEIDLLGMRDLAARPVRWLPQAAEATARYRKMSGLDQKIAADDAWLERGTTQASEGFRLSQDPRTFIVAGAPFRTLVLSADTNVILARGEYDGMVSLDELRAYRPDAVQIDAAVHNVHVEKPAAVVELFDRLVAHA